MPLHITSGLPQDSAEFRAAELELRAQTLERRDWWLFSGAILIILLLGVTVLSLSLPASMGHDGPPFHHQLHLVTALLGLVVLFSLYAIYQQVLIKRLRSDLSTQLSTAVVLQARADMFRRLAILDPVTNLYNHRFAVEHLPVEIDRAERHRYDLTLVMLGLDNFSQISESYGRAAGDLVLNEFSRRLRKAFRSSDLPVRMGTDEFIVMLPECTNQQVPNALTRLADVEISLPSGQKIPITFTAGWVEHQFGQTAEQLLERAYEALSNDKRTRTAEQKVKNAEAEIRQAEKMQAVGRLAGGVAHDFNNLLEIIIGYSDLLLEDLDSSDPRRKPAEEIMQAAERAATLTRQLLMFSRKQPLQPQLLDLNSVVADAEVMLQRMLGEDIELVKSPSASPALVNADSGQIQQVLLNLAVNARDAMSQGGRLFLEVNSIEVKHADSRNQDIKPGSYVQLLVRDTGCGMDDETRSKIFEPFFTTKGLGKGTGLGLATVYAIVKQSSGHIRVDSKLGSGTTFTIYLPRVGQPSVSPITAQTPKNVTGTETVLLVEDEDRVRVLVREILRRHGYTILEAESPQAAIELAERQDVPIQLLLTDVVMPGMNGCELATHINLLRPQTKRLFMSGYTNELLSRQGVLKPGMTLVAKPFTQELLLSRVREVLDTEEMVTA